MVNILNLITIGEKKYLVLDGDPALNGGVSAEVGSLAVWEDGSNVGRAYLKIGAGDTDWDKISTSSDGGIAEGGYLKLPIYNTDSSGQTLDDVVSQGSGSVSVKVEAGSRASAQEYTIPAIGGVSANFVMSEGAQTINGDKTFGNNVVVQGDLTVNGSLTSLSTTNTDIEDKLLTLNKGGAAGSAGGSGLEFEENALITGFLKVAASRDGFDLKSPAVASKLTLDLAGLSSDRVLSAPDESGVAVIRGLADAGVQYQVPVYDTANKITSYANFRYDSSLGKMTVGSIGGDHAELIPASLTVMSNGGAKGVYGHDGLWVYDAAAADLFNISSDGTDTYFNAASGALTIASGSGVTTFDNGSAAEAADFLFLGVGGTLVEIAEDAIEQKAIISSGSPYTGGMMLYASAGNLQLMSASGNAILRAVGLGHVQIQSDSGITEFLDPAAGVRMSLSLQNAPGAESACISTPSGTRLNFVLGNDLMSFYDSTFSNVEQGSISTASNQLQINSAVGDLVLNPSTGSHVRVLNLSTGIVHADIDGRLSSSALDLTADVGSSVLPIANGGTNSSTALNNNRMIVSSAGAIVEHSAMTQGSVLFADADGLPGQDNSNLFWDAANGYLGLHTNAPGYRLHVMAADFNTSSGSFYLQDEASNDYIEMWGKEIDINNVTSGAGLFTWVEDDGIANIEATGRLNISGSDVYVASLFATDRIRFGSSYLDVDSNPSMNIEFVNSGRGVGGGSQQTTDASVYTLDGIEIPANSCVLITSTVLARRSGGTSGSVGDSAVYVRSARFSNIAGVVTMRDLQSNYTSEDQPAFNATLAVSGTMAIINVRGAANNTIDWHAWSEVRTFKV